ncbi:MAG TPA: trypsin-like peptidase domain-containing protein [Candidatus Limnocylindria bacterium]|nr:trypsin-like peptidase domain-containing protein [Candidatus Limnocylindria bacterium]
MAGGCITVVQAPSATVATTLPVSSSTPQPTSTATPTAAATATRLPPAEVAAAATVLIDSPAGHGSGVYMGSNRVLTAAHVVTGRGPFTVSFRDRKVNVAVITSLDLGDDLALLSVAGIDASGATPIAWGDVSQLRLGDHLTVVGYPSFVGLTATQGIFSGLKTDDGRVFVQPDAAVNPGNSGGPVVNDAGQLVGIADFIVLGAQGLNFAVASTSARPFVERGVTTAGPSVGDPFVIGPLVMALYYAYLQAHDYYSAWSMLSEEARLAQAYTEWVNGYSQTITTRFQVSGTTRLASTSARVSGSVVATENFSNNPPGFVTQSTYVGYYDVAYVGARWMVLAGSLSLSTRGFVRR